MFSFLAYGFEWENCLSELADVTGQLKTTCPIPYECSCCLWDFTEAKSVLKKSIHHVLLRFVLLAHFSFHFSSSSSNFRAVSLFVFSDFLRHLWQVYICIFICALHQSSIALSSFSLSCPGLLVRRCHLFNYIFQHLSESSSSVIHSVSLWRVKGSCKSYYKSEVIGCWCSNDCFPVHWGVSLCKNAGARVKCFKCCCGGSKVKVVIYVPFLAQQGRSGYLLCLLTPLLLG